MKSAFTDRHQAGQLLGEFLKSWSFDRNNTLVLALPRGGVLVGYEIAKTLKIPLDVLVVEKIGHPLHPEYYLSGADQSMNERLLNYRKSHPLPSLQDKTVILVDDGLMTGVTAMVAAESIKAKGAREVVLATPACAKRTAIKLRTNFENVACLIEPIKFVSVAHFYKNFDDVSEDEVIHLLNRASEELNQTKTQSAAADPLTQDVARDHGSVFVI